ncbi:TetR/AcrR family transcriptional regulator [Nocardia sp. CDC159]|uniref:TetR/AcrR family transcriptional regulator n=1 Tax=Nocardia pulmonis TaxID=2951408 RepID=A0A9X2IWH1_9NOCA|nr:MULTISPECIES: TetR/AcrR family transcriptional regulator [Nocardia]MCM6771881.1 TetR/AcrR family transcriptional regulator [Nocardia pulmonis]MCM6785461.1 TetR/AcrR family transcriptional regulator [Nocardia sp. CDC159]
MGRRSTAREQMLNSAAALFRERGVDATSMADVVEHAHAPRGSIYHHFPDGKAQLAEEATRRAGALMGSMIAASLAQGDPVATLRMVVEFFRQQLSASDFRAGCPVAAAALEGGDQPRTRQVAGEAFTSWEQLIAAALWQRGLPMARAESIATMAVAAIEGALLLAKAKRSSEPLDNVESELSGWVRAMVGREGQS